MNKKEAENCLTLADLLVSVKNEDYDHKSVCGFPCCALGHARWHPRLFSKGYLSGLDFGVKAYQQVFFGKKLTRAGARRKLLKIVKDAGWIEDKGETNA